MKTGRPKQALNLTAEARQDLEAFANSRSMPHGLVQRAKIVLLAAQGHNNALIAEKLRISRPTVGIW